MSNLFDLIPPTWFYLMILIDAVIAFIIPVWVWWRQLQKNERIKLFSNLLKTNLLDPFKEEIMKELKEELEKICTNEIPHAIEQKMVDLRADLKQSTSNLQSVADHVSIFREDIEGLRNQLARTLGAIGNAGKQQKKAQRLLMYNELMEKHPDKAESIKISLLLKQAGIIDQKMLDMFIGYQTGGIGGLIGKNQESFSVWPEGPTANIQATSQGEKESHAEEAGMGSVSEKEQIAYLKQYFRNQGVPDEITNAWIAEGKAAKKEKGKDSLEKMGDELNGKEEKERKRKESDISGSSADKDSVQDGS